MVKLKDLLKEGSLYSSQQLIQKLTPKIEKDIEFNQKMNQYIFINLLFFKI